MDGRANLTPWLSLLVLASVNLSSTGCIRCCSRHTAQPAGSSPNEVIQEFPSRASMQTAWRVRWDHATGKGLFITGAWFKRSPNEPWMRVLWDARVADIFVPYHTGSPRYFDLTGFSFNLVQATPVDAGCCGRLLGTPPVVVKEVRDRGPLWKDDTDGRRGEELVLWGTVDAANYNYIIQYGFRDDGTMSFRIGATARNLPGRETEAHMHNGLWRVDLDLNGFLHDAALLVRHIESTAGLTATDVTAPFNGGLEGSADWEDLEFLELRVEDTQRTNAQGKRFSYDLLPLRRGSARHLEPFSHHDFWVTRYRGTELNYAQLPTYVSNTESVIDNDVVLWHISPVHHLPRDEDGRFEGAFWRGVALLMWGGFDLRPRNLFDETPLHP